MKKENVEIGKTYLVKVSGKLVPVKLIRKYDSFSWYLHGWVGVNLKTNREIHIKTAAKLHRELPIQEDINIYL